MRAIETELGLVVEFPPEVTAAAQQAAAHPRLPDLDRTDVPLVTIDPEGSMDLDQALHFERLGDGYRVYYAIADVAAFVEPGGVIDVEAHQRGQTLYGPEHRIPLHPPVLSEGAASLLPGEIRPALLWTIDLDAMGEGVQVDVVRARVTSRARHDYASVQKQVDSGAADNVFALLKEIGELRLERERERGGVSLPLPEQEVVVDGGHWSLVYRQLLPVESWNAQISLLTGMGAAEIMLYGEAGIVRTLPKPPDSAIIRLRRTARGLHLEWDPDLDYPDFVRTLDPNTGPGAAMLNACTTLLRGAGYVAFDGGVPEHIEHAAIANEYAHTTAPLRRLVDRYAGEACVALCADQDIPDWVRRALKDLPKEMEASDRLAHRYERAVVDLVEAGVLASRVGETFTGVVTEVDTDDATSGSVVLSEPAVEAKVTTTGDRLPLGEDVQVRLVEADKTARKVRFELL
ncbi:MAG: RNB domain-containing ribonuclease [Nocardioidaceae bacterium]|nr:RNB domain-containing ribonuclease [Nocardioidaceae bacterium]